MTDADLWNYRNKPSGEQRGPTTLALSWEVVGDPITDDYTPAEASADELWARWVRKYPDPVKPVYWSVISPRGEGVAEFAPFLGDGDGEDFLTVYTWPLHATSGERVRWAALPVLDKLWDAKHSDKGGFIQSATGWKPAPFQTTVDTALLAKASGLAHP